jgi:DNA topoisomerase-1
MARLRRVDCSGPGLTRRRRGRGFEYRDQYGGRVADEEVIQRIGELGIPPAWTNVWICPTPMGHIQATGIDAAGRKQYIYHQKWREHRDREKFDGMLDFARALPRMRQAVAADLQREGMPRERVLACAVRMLDRGFIRVGGEAYAADNESYGLATIQKRHARVDGERIRLDYQSKSGRRQVQSIVDVDAAPVVEKLKRRRGGSPELLAFKRSGRWQDVKSTDINEYVKEVTGGDFTAKDFRTWNATVLAAVALAVSGPAATSKTARKRAISRAVKEVAHYLGNTPAVCRSSYIDSRVFDRYEEGLTIGGALVELAADGEEEDELSIQGPIEEAVLELIAAEETPAVEKVA